MSTCFSHFQFSISTKICPFFVHFIFSPRSGCSDPIDSLPLSPTTETLHNGTMEKNHSTFHSTEFLFNFFYFTAFTDEKALRRIKRNIVKQELLPWWRLANGRPEMGFYFMFTAHCLCVIFCADVRGSYNGGENKGEKNFCCHQLRMWSESASFSRILRRRRAPPTTTFNRSPTIFIVPALVFCEKKGERKTWKRFISVIRPKS